MQRKRLPGFVIAFAIVFTIIFSFTAARAAEFTADIAITGPGDNYTFKLSVRDNMYRLQKTEGPMNMPPYPTIVNCDTAVTLGLNPQMRQYVEIEHIEKTIMMNPLIGWAMTRNNYTEKAGPVEILNGYECETWVYTEAGKSEPVAKVWFSKKLQHIMRDERYGLNKNPVLELKNIQEGPVDPALFEIPAGYTQVDMGGGPGPNPPATAAKKVTAAANPKPAPVSSSASASAQVTTKPTPAPVSSGNLIFILDASGSMWGQVEGKAKIAIAKEVLTGLIKDLPDDAVVGLVAYGHRRKGDCNDVEELVPLGKIDKNILTRTVQGLSPKGKTPISRSVRMTADRIKHLEDETTIILVSDGKETCDPDPCGLVKELKEAGVKFVMHVIGFDVTEEEKAQLECMAQAGGGEYFTAKNAKDFQMAAKEVVKKASEKPPVSLQVTCIKDEKPIKAYVQVLTQGGEKHVAEGWTSIEKPAAFRLPPGMYDIRAQDQSVIQRPTVDIKDVEIVEGQTTERVVNFATEGILHVKAIKNNAPIKTYVKVFRQEDEKYMRDGWTREEGKPSEFKLLPGVYKISVQDDSVTQRPVIWIENVEVKPGQTVERIATFGEGGILQVKAIKSNAPVKTYVKVHRQEDNKYMRDGWTREDGTPAEFKLLPGIYKIYLQDQSVKQRPVIWIENVEVKPGETVERIATFGAGGILRVKAIKSNAPAKTYVKVFRQEDKKYMGDGWTREDGRPAEYKLLPGIYKIQLQDQSVKQRPEVWIEDVEVKADQTTERYATFVAGGVLNVTATRDGAPYKAYVKIYLQQDDKYMGDGWAREDGRAAEYKLLPGTYYAKVEDRKDRSVRELRDIQVQSGKTVTVNAAFPVEKAPEPQAQPEAAPSPTTIGGGAASAGSGEPTAGSHSIMNGEVPLMEGAKVLKTMTYGPNIQAAVEVPASPQDIIDFYKQAMPARGWQPGMAMVQGNKGVLQMAGGKGQLMFKIEGNGESSKVSIVLVGQ